MGKGKVHACGRVATTATTEATTATTEATIAVTSSCVVQFVPAARRRQPEATKDAAIETAAYAPHSKPRQARLRTICQ
jgi:hypothetical protein